jgi:hypothetical protein
VLPHGHRRHSRLSGGACNALGAALCSPRRTRMFAGLVSTFSDLFS